MFANQMTGLTDLASGQAAPFHVVDGDIRFSLTLGPRQPRVVAVNGGGGPGGLIHLPLLIVGKPWP